MEEVMNQDIADNVLEKGKEGIKENFMEAFSEFADEYVDEMWALVNELIRLRNENQILREKKSPEKPVSLVEYTRIKDELRSKVDYIHEQDEVIKEYKHRAEIAEDELSRHKRALRIAGDKFINEVCNMRGEDISDKCDYKCDTCFYDYYLQQAEKELAEEGKDD